MSINRNIVECKYSCYRTGYFSQIVLIETLWNVNKIPKREAEQKSEVLIETLWNVNEIQRNYNKKL